MSDCDTSSCCWNINYLLIYICDSTEAVIPVSWGATEPMRDIVNGFEGVFVEIPGGDLLPSLAELIGRISNFGAGFDLWSFFETREAATRTVLNLPAAIPDPTKIATDLNAVRLSSPRDYTVTGSVLTLTHPLNRGDLLTMKTYGA